MNLKYDLVVFPNGRVVFFKNEDFDKAIENGQELVISCTAWTGGYTHVKGANKIPNYYVSEDSPDFGKDCWECYGYDIRNKEFTTEDLKKFYKVIFSNGFMVKMKSGDQATYYRVGQFMDWNSKYAESLKRFDMTEGEFNKMRSMVDERAVVCAVLHETDGKDKLETLIAYRIVSPEARQYVTE